MRATNLRFGATASEITLPCGKFQLNLVGELNVRNGLAVVGVAEHCGLANKHIQTGFDTFKGVKRRMEVRGVAGGVTVLDDFGHHPTAIRETLKALRIKYPGQKIWAIFEPRTQSTRRNVFQNDFPTAFGEADTVIIAEVAFANVLRPEERLDTARLESDLKAGGKHALFLPDVDTIINHLAQHAQGGNVVCVFTNGGFGNIHSKLLERLGKR